MCLVSFTVAVGAVTDLKMNMYSLTCLSSPLLLNDLLWRFLKDLCYFTHLSASRCSSSFSLSSLLPHLSLPVWPMTQISIAGTCKPHIAPPGNRSSQDSSLVNSLRERSRTTVLSILTETSARRVTRTYDPNPQSHLISSPPQDSALG